MAQQVKEPDYNAGDTGDLGSVPGLRRSPGGGNGNHSSILACKIPCRDEPGGLHSMGLQRVGHNWATNTLTFSLTHRKCIGKVVTPIFFFSLFLLDHPS